MSVHLLSIRQEFVLCRTQPKKDDEVVEFYKRFMLHPEEERCTGCNDATNRSGGLLV